MFLFLKLYFAHLIGDFVLQFEELYRLKTKSWKGHVLHVIIHALVSLVVALPLLGHFSVWIFIFAVTVLHLAEDLLKYHLQQKHPSWRFFLFTADQAVHAAVIACVFFFPVRHLQGGFENFPAFNPYYLSNTWTLVGILFLLTTFGAGYFLHAFVLNFVKNVRQDQFITRFELLHGILERSWVSGVFLLLSPLAALGAALAAGALRTLHPRLRSVRDFALSAGLAAILGCLFKNWIHF